uniref:Uncharacterized protein n=1 Tax=Rhizophagus irregularis (strain DAOM 181602 / DAOM 197198 / MUCL 43194) TaxID=747089 RepID=U9T8M0_RHIID
MLAEIKWPYTFKVFKGNIELTNFSEYELNLFKVKIRTKELPILDNLIKRKLHVYKQVNQNMIGKLQQYIQDLILANS